MKKLSFQEKSFSFTPELVLCFLVLYGRAQNATFGATGTKADTTGSSSAGDGEPPREPSLPEAESEAAAAAAAAAAARATRRREEAEAAAPQRRPRPSSPGRLAFRGGRGRRWSSRGGSRRRGRELPRSRASPPESDKTDFLLPDSKTTFFRNAFVLLSFSSSAFPLFHMFLRFQFFRLFIIMTAAKTCFLRGGNKRVYFLCKIALSFSSSFFFLLSAFTLLPCCFSFPPSLARASSLSLAQKGRRRWRSTVSSSSSLALLPEKVRRCRRRKLLRRCRAAAAGAAVWLPLSPTEARKLPRCFSPLPRSSRPRSSPRKLESMLR